MGRFALERLMRPTAKGNRCIFSSWDPVKATVGRGHREIVLFAPGDPSTAEDAIAVIEDACLPRGDTSFRREKRDIGLIAG